MSIQGVVAETIYVFSSVLKLLIFARVLLSWFPRMNLKGKIIVSAVNVVTTMTDPILRPVWRLLNHSPLAGMNTVIDFSPIFSYFLVDSAVLLIVQIVYAF